MDKPTKLNLTDSEKEIISLNKSLIDKEHKFSIRVFFTILSLLVAILGFLYKERVDNTILLTFVFLLLFIFSVRETLTYADLRKDYWKLIDAIKNNKLSTLEIPKITRWKKINFAIEILFFLFIVLFITSDNFKIALVISIILTVIFYVLLHKRLEY